MTVPVPMKKTCLVIDCRRLCNLSMDGPALRVQLEQQSSRLFPLRRLSRIHVIGCRSLAAGFDALLGCAERQIPVAFFTLNGKLRCQLYFPVIENGILSHWLEHVEFDPQAKDEYGHWLEYQQLHVLSIMGFRKGCREQRAQRVNEQLHALCNRQLGRKTFALAVDWLQGMLDAHISQLIVEHGLANQSRGKRRLMDDIAPLCGIWIKGKLAEEAGGSKKPSVNGIGMSALYQRHADQLEYMVRRMLVQLCTRLESII